MRSNSKQQSAEKQAVDGEKETTEHLKRLIIRYKKEPRPIPVNFRQLVPWIPYNSERASHYIHSYPAKLLLHIPHFFVSNSLLTRPNDTVADPFCGSGTVLLEAIMAGRNAFGTDNNPLACLVARAKTTPLHAHILNKALRDLDNRLPTSGDYPPPDVVNLSHWFYPHVIKQLVSIRFAIESITDVSVRDFFWVCFSSCVRKVSLSDPRIAVPVRMRPDTYPDGHPLREKSRAFLNQLRRINVMEYFRDIVEKNISRINSLTGINPSAKAYVSLSDARSINSTARCQGAHISLIVTSPPYAGAQKYVRACSLSLGWLGLCRSHQLRALEEQSIGREHYPRSEHGQPLKIGIPQADRFIRKIYKEYPLRAHIAGNYLLEMHSAFTSMADSLKPGGHIVLVAGNNYVCGYPFKTREYLKFMLRELGLKLELELLDTIKSRGLMTKRNATANLITREAVMLFQKA